MALILPRSYHKITAIERNCISWIEPELAERQDIRPLRIGILNIMPLGKQYEFNLLHPLGLSPLQIEPIWIRLHSHAYRTWDHTHLNDLYIYWEEATARAPLDGLIITGAPVEHLPFEQVTYWLELVELIAEAKHSCASTLGLCWAGFTLAFLAVVLIHGEKALIFANRNEAISCALWGTKFIKGDIDTPLTNET